MEIFIRVLGVQPKSFECGALPAERCTFEFTPQKMTLHV